MKLENKIQTELNFFNTINLEGSELKGATESCNRQEERILEIMTDQIPMTPVDVHYSYQLTWGETPLTSIRRAITVLTKKGKLEKLDEMKEGAYGKPNHKWRVK